MGMLDCHDDYENRPAAKAHSSNKKRPSLTQTASILTTIYDDDKYIEPA